MSDAVHHPVHYGGADNPYEAIKVIEAWSLGFHLGNAVKYISRAGKKGDAVEDIKKRRGISPEKSNGGRPMADLTFTSDITVRLIQKTGGDEMVVAAARVSTSGQAAVEWADPAKADESYGLIRYLMKHRHGTPFEHSSLTFFVHAPIFVWREWHRHRIGFSYNEESARYKQLDPVFYVAPPGRPSRRVDGWKPGRPKFEVDPKLTASVNERNKFVYRAAYAAYLENLAAGADPGFARDCLPVGIYSSCWVTCNPRSIMAFLSLRTNNEAATFVSYPLYEIEIAARACEQVFDSGWPLTCKAWRECGRVAP